MNSPRDRNNNKVPISLLREFDAICNAFEEAQLANQSPDLESYLKELSGRRREVLLTQLLALELSYKYGKKGTPSVTEYVTRFPAHRRVVEEVFKRHAANVGTRPVGYQGKDRKQTQAQAIHIRCPHCHNAVELAIDTSFDDIECTSCGSHFSLVGDDSGTQEASEVASIGHFELVERLGIGGFGTVWKARDKELDRTVALKIPRKGQLRPAEREKFLREARTAAQLKHPHIVTVYEVGRDEETDTVYIVSDIVRGVSLSDWSTGKTPTASEAAELCATIADALDHAHRSGVVHRDLKPQNIIVDADGKPHLTDFGLAKRESGEITMTIDGQVLGTPAYMPPEQASGAGHEADGRSDIYSLGVILFQLLTGELPFRGNARMLIHQVMHDEAPSPRRLNGNIHRDMETICLKCMEKEPGKRYQEAADLADDLRRFLRNEPIRARPIGNITRGWRWCRRNPAVSSLTLAVGCVFLLGFMFSSYFAWRAAKSEQQKDIALADALLNASKAINEAGSEGYRPRAHDIIRSLVEFDRGPDRTTLRHEAVRAMGDFVGLPPLDHHFLSDVTCIAADSRGRFIAVGMTDGNIQLIQPRQGAKTEDFPGQGQGVIGLVAIPSGDGFISVYADGRVIVRTMSPSGIWDEKDLLQLDAPYESVRITRDCTYLVARNKTRAAVFDLEQGIHIATYTPEHLNVRSAVLSPDKKYLMVGYGDERDGGRGFIAWNVRDGKEEHREPLDFGNQYANSMSFDSTGALFVYGCDQMLFVYEVSGFQRLWRRHSDAVIAAAFSPDDQMVVSYDIRGHVSLLSVATGERIAALSHRRKRRSEQSIVFSADGAFMAAAHFDAVRIWHVFGAAERRILRGHDKAIPCVAFSPKGDIIATASKDHTVGFWDHATRERIGSLDVFSGAVQCVEFSADGNFLVTAHWGENNEIELWDVQSKTLVGSTQHALGEVRRLAFATTRDRLAAVGRNGVAVWDVDMDRDAKGPIRFTPVYARSGETCYCIAWGDKDRLLAWSHSRNKQTWVQVETLVPHSTAPTRFEPLDSAAPPMLQGWHGLAFLPDSRKLTYIRSQAASENREAGGAVQVWDLQTNKSVYDGNGDVRLQSPHIALTPHGPQLAALIDADTVGIWDLASGERQFALRPERSAIWSLAWSPDGTQLAVGLSDGGLAVWDLRLINKELAKLGF